MVKFGFHLNHMLGMQRFLVSRVFRRYVVEERHSYRGIGTLEYVDTRIPELCALLVVFSVDIRITKT